MAAGTRRLLALTVPSPAKRAREGLTGAAQLTLAAAPHGALRAVLDDAAAAAIDALVAEAGGPAWDERGVTRLRERVALALPERTAMVLTQMVEILDAARDVQRTADAITAIPLQPQRADVVVQVEQLVRPGFATWAGAARLPDVLRYVRGAEQRLRRLPDNVAVDRDRMAAVHELEGAHRELLASWPPGRPLPAELREVPWMLQELRMGHFAQGLGARKVTAKRIRKALDDARATLGR